METGIKKELEELAKVQAEPVKEISEEAARELTQETPINGDGGKPDPQTINLNVFGAAVIGVYCKVSDLIYERIKKHSAPQWDNETKQELTEQFNAVLAAYSIPVNKPIYGLLVTLAMCEVMRYTKFNNNINN